MDSDKYSLAIKYVFVLQGGYAIFIPLLFINLLFKQLIGSRDYSAVQHWEKPSGS